MNKTTYSGAYSRRRYSNAAAIVGSSSASPFSGGGTASYTLDAYADNPERGKVSVAVVEQNVTVHAGGGMEFASGNAKRYAPGTVVRLSAYANTGYRFAGWSANIPGSPQSSNNPLTVRMNGNYTIVARFVPVGGGTVASHTLRVDWNREQGRVTASGNAMQNGEMSVRTGDQVTLEAAPADGYVFKCWAGVSKNTTSRTITVTMPDHDLSLTAVFAKSAETPGGGGGTPGGGTSDTPPDKPTDGPVVGNVTGSTDLVGKAVAFAKQWWWALLIVGYIAYKEMKGGRR
ncbi:MAG: InlB B-repeat-containing protein [Bacteroidales bacterium]|nr:InlB B-repeat-containing protein [Bacteroidales bacterium]